QADDWEGLCGTFSCGNSDILRTVGNNSPDRHKTPRGNILPDRHARTLIADLRLPRLDCETVLSRRLGCREFVSCRAENCRGETAFRSENCRKAAVGNQSVRLSVARERHALSECDQTKIANKQKNLALVSN